MAFLRIPIERLHQFFDNGEIAEIYIPFPDPRSTNADSKKRLTNPLFLNLYRNVLKDGGIVHVKTDSVEFFNYTLKVLQDRIDVHNIIYTEDLYSSSLLSLHQGIKTSYEEKYLNQGITIKYLQFSLKK